MERLVLAEVKQQDRFDRFSALLDKKAESSSIVTVTEIAEIRIRTEKEAQFSTEMTPFSAGSDKQ